MAIRQTHPTGWYMALLVGAAIACTGSTSDETGGIPAKIAVVAGSTQVAPVNTELPGWVRFMVLDHLGNPVKGVKVRIDIDEGDGDIPVPDQITGPEGTVQTRWVLGPFSGRQTITATVKGLAVARVDAQATGCDKPECPDFEIADDFVEEMGLPTYERSNQVVHPDVVLQPREDTHPWYWLTITPYPNGNSFYENPSIFRSFNGKFWRVPKVLVKPIAWPTEAHLSDPDMVYDTASKQFWLYFRSVSQSSNTIMLKRSTDGTHWGETETVLKVPSHQAVSPGIVHGAPGAPWMMWVVDAGAEGCVSLSSSVVQRSSSDGLHWSAPVATDLAQPGEIIWHLDMAWVPSRAEYWALYTTYLSGTKCTTDKLYLATSPDGIHWRQPTNPIVRAGGTSVFQDVVYRSSIMPSTNGEKTTIWLSGANYDMVGYRWAAAMVRYNTAELLALAYGPRVSGAFGPVKSWLPAPEPNDVGIGN